MERIELYKNICELFGEEKTVDRIDFVELDGVKYSHKEIEELDVEDEGKYQTGGTIYAIGILDEEKGYGIKETLFYIEQDFTRSGSYFSEYYYEFESPYVVEQREIVKTIWKAV